MKHSIYVSSTKIDMLLPQIEDKAKPKTSTELKVDLKLLSILRKSERELGESLFRKLDTIVRYIERYEEVGTVDEPQSYISDTMELAWRTDKIADDHVVYFAGASKGMILCLGGSKKHLIGEPQMPDCRSSSYGMSLFHGLLLRLLQSDGDEFSMFESGGPYHERLPGLISESRNYSSHIFNHTGKQKLEFLAKVLLLADNPFDYTDIPIEQLSREDYEMASRKILIATPIYVALAD